MSSESVTEAKKAFRTRAFAARKQLSQAQAGDASVRMSQHLRDWLATVPDLTTVSATLQFGTEPDTDAVLETLVEEGVTVYIPATQDKGQMAWGAWDKDLPLVRSAHGSMREPTGELLPSTELPPLDVVIVPALAVDCNGYRMGKGGGYYDRFLAQLLKTSGTRQAPALTPILITPVFEMEFYRDSAPFPVDDHDLPVDGVVTEVGIHWF